MNGSESINSPYNWEFLQGREERDQSGHDCIQWLRDCRPATLHRIAVKPGLGDTPGIGRQGKGDLWEGEVLDSHITSCSYINQRQGIGIQVHLDVLPTDFGPMPLTFTVLPRAVCCACSHIMGRARLSVSAFAVQPTKMCSQLLLGWVLWQEVYQAGARTL